MDLYCLTRQLSLLNLSVLHFLLHQYFRLSLSAQLNRLSRLSLWDQHHRIRRLSLWDQILLLHRLSLWGQNHQSYP